VGEEADAVGRGDEEPKEAVEVVMSPLLHDVLPAFGTLMADDELVLTRCAGPPFARFLFCLGRKRTEHSGALVTPRLPCATQQ